jgi:glycosyltransferase involved in cell wall biosynthesis
LRRLRADIYHVTGDINYFALLLPCHRTILTVHDIGHYRLGLRGIRKLIYRWLWLVWPIRFVRAATAVSAETRDSIVGILHVPSDKIEVIENCHSPLFQRAPRVFDAECPVILQVGTKPYKNVPRLVLALRGLRCRLVLVGALDKPIEDALRDSNLDYVNRTNLSHEEVYQEYVRSDIVAFVSIGEGFGVPIIEGQAVGRPVVTSNVSPMKEVAGDGACLVDPLDVSAIRRALDRIIADTAYRERVVRDGLRNASRFSPSLVAARHLALYRRISGVP